jgi:fumarylacetoacetate (FAA) hydrolase
MRLATLKDGSPDGKLIVVSPDGAAYAVAPVATLQQALEHWDTVEPDLRAITSFPEALDPALLLAPLPRAWQWLDGSVYPSHGALMDKALGITPFKPDWPQMYQGVSDTFHAPRAQVPMASEELGIDFEGEFGIITSAVPMGTPAAEAGRYIRLVVQINDWSLRKLAGPEMRTGFGWIQAKPPCGMAPFAVTPDELEDAWRDFRPAMRLCVHWNGRQFGNADGAGMAYGFHELVAHAARTRNLVAGTVIGSGTVSNENYREVGSSCIAERRGIEIVDTGAAETDFMKYGDSVRMEARTADGRSPFGVLEQTVVQHEQRNIRIRLAAGPAGRHRSRRERSCPLPVRGPFADADDRQRRRGHADDLDHGHGPGRQQRRDRRPRAPDRHHAQRRFGNPHRRHAAARTEPDAPDQFDRLRHRAQGRDRARTRGRGQEDRP